MTAIWWYLGDKVDDFVIVHNSAYEEHLRNPGGPQYGRLTSDAWAGEHWPTLKKRAHHCMNTGQGVSVDDEAFFAGHTEVAWSWRWTPILGPKGERREFRGEVTARSRGLTRRPDPTPSWHLRVMLDCHDQGPRPPVPRHVSYTGAEPHDVKDAK